jgi:hypothetical protein
MSGHARSDPAAPPLSAALVGRGETAPCFIVRDANQQALAFVYCEDEPGRRTTDKLLTRDEAPASLSTSLSCRGY